MKTSQVLTHFRALRPELKVRPKVVDGRMRRAFVVKRGDARGAIPGDPCQCTIARASRRELKVAEALVLTNVAYLLEPTGGGHHQVAKYLHDGDGVVKALDASGIAVWNTTITLRPPSANRRVGAQTPAQKAALPGTGKQTSEHVARRVASRMANPAMARQGRVG